MHLESELGPGPASPTQLRPWAYDRFATLPVPIGRLEEDPEKIENGDDKCDEGNDERYVCRNCHAGLGVRS